MAVIRKFYLQKIYYQLVTKTTTEMGISNDRFGVN